MIEISRRPYKYCFSKNAIPYTFSVPNFADAGCYVMVRVYSRAIGGSYGLLYEEKVKPLSDSVTVNISDIIEADLDYSFPDFDGDTFQAAGNIKDVYISFCTITDAAPTATYISDAANFIYVIKGGIAAPLWDWNNYFINYFATNKPFLTWQPDNRFIGLNDSFFISWLGSLASFPVTMLVDVEFTDGATHQSTFALAETKILHHIQAGPDQLGLNVIDTTKRLYKYSLSIVSSADHAIIYANKYTFYIDYRKFYNTKYFHYYNSLGGIECVRIRGEIESNIDITTSDAEKYEGSIIIGSPNSEQYTQTAKSKIDTFKGDAGFLFTKSEQDAFQELMLTRFAWERIIGKNWRIYVTSKAWKIRSTADKKWGVPIEWRYSFTNSVYTPMIDLGAGTDGYDYCVPVSTPAEGSTPEGVVGIAYSHSFTVTGTAPFALGTVSKPSWMTVTLDGDTITLSGTPDAAATDIEISIQVTNCDAGSAVFTDVINVVEYLDHLDPANYTVDLDTGDTCTIIAYFTRTADAQAAATAASQRMQAIWHVVANSGCEGDITTIFEPGDLTTLETIELTCMGYCSDATATLTSLEPIA